MSSPKPKNTFSKISWSFPTFKTWVSYTSRNRRIWLSTANM